MGTARINHTATVLPKGKVLVAGGNSYNISVASAELYDPIAGIFTTTDSMNVARESHTATLLPNGKVLITGSFSFIGAVIGCTSSAELYDAAAGTFSATGSMSVGRGAHTATLLQNGKVLIAGGDDLSQTFASAELFDPVSGTFTPTGHMRKFRAYHTATLLQSGKVLILGGIQYPDQLPNAELYDPATGTFSATGSTSVGRTWSTATLLADGKVLVAGGTYFNYGNSVWASAEIYDPAQGSFTSTGNMLLAREFHTGTLLPNGKVLIAGGVNINNTNLVQPAELYDPTIGSFTSTGSMATGRFRHTASPLASGNVLVRGGQVDFNSALAGAEIFLR
jgi:Galactose oxidase, central domain